MCEALSEKKYHLQVNPHIDSLIEDFLKFIEGEKLVFLIIRLKKKYQTKYQWNNILTDKCAILSSTFKNVTELFFET